MSPRKVVEVIRAGAARVKPGGPGADDVTLIGVYNILLNLGLDDIGGIAAIPSHREELLQAALEAADEMHLWEFIKVVDAIACDPMWGGLQ